MSHTEHAESIEPFWQRLRPIAGYPFRGDALITLALLSVGQLLVLLPFLGWLIGLLLLATAYKYAFTALRDTANGHLDPRHGVLEAPDAVVVKFLVLNISLMAAVVVAALTLGPGTALVLILLFSFIQPAAIMALAMDESLSGALNPATWFGIIGRIGWPYLVLFLLLLVFQISATNAQGWLAAFLPSVVAIVLAQAAFLWGLFGTFHLMGYLLYQYHEELGFEPSRHAHAAELPRNRDSALVTTATGLVQDGQPDAALALLREEIASRAVPLDAHELYRRLLRQAGASEEMNRHGRTFLHLLMLEKQDRRALGLVRECLDADPGFAPLQPEDGLVLAERARLLGQTQLALDILQGVRRTHPRDRAAAQAALKAAALLVDRLGRDQDARTLLTEARGTCRDETLGAEIDAALAAIPSSAG